MKTELELQKEFIENPELKEQLDFIKQGGASGIQGVVLVEAFLKGIRDLGYKNTPYALNEINDNSFQAGARNIHYELIGTSNKIDEMVIYDDGHGMVKDMLTVAVTWGGTHNKVQEKALVNMDMDCHQPLSLAKNILFIRKSKVVIGIKLYLILLNSKLLINQVWMTSDRFLKNVIYQNLLNHLRVKI